MTEHLGQRERVIKAFIDRSGRFPEIVVRAPGRVNLLGAHVDYNEGWVLPAATDQAVWLAAARAKGSQTTVQALDFDGQVVQIEQDNPQVRDTDRPVTWADYPAGVAWALRSVGKEVPAIEATFGGDIPIGAGVSSSAAVEVAFLEAWNHLGDLNLSTLEMARLGQKTENAYIGLASGIMDQFASIHAMAGKLMLLDCRTLEHTYVPLPEHCAILVADSGIRRVLAGSEYNVRRSQCAQAVQILQQFLPNIQALRDVSAGDMERLAHHLPVTVRRRAQHVVDECARVLAGADTLRRGDLSGFGRLISQSHRSARDLYEVSIPELDLLAAAASEGDGCYGARLTGAGFGGCVIVLCEAEVTGNITLHLKARYKEAFGITPRIFATSAAQGAGIM